MMCRWMMIVPAVLLLASSAWAADATAWRQQGDAAFLTADYPKAARMYEQALVAAPGNDLIRKRLEKAVIAKVGDGFLSGLTREVQKKGDVRLSAKKLVKRLAAGEEIVLVDVRTPQEQALVVPVGARLLPMDQVMKHLDRLPTDRLVVVICHSSPRAIIVTSVLRMLGYANAYALKGGIMALADVNARKAPDNLHQRP